MIELEFLGLNPEGSHVVFTDSDGERYTVAITAELRSAVRRNRPALASVNDGEVLRPRQVQELLRAGVSAEEIAVENSIPLEQIRAFEAPVISERVHITSIAKKLPVNSESDSPCLEDVVLDRLTARGVDTANLSWDAFRRHGEPWRVVLNFVQSATEKQATWSLNSALNSITAEDQEAKWLTETVVPAPPSSSLSFLPSHSFSTTESSLEDDFDDSFFESDSNQATQTESLLDELAAARGIVQPDEYEEAIAEEANSNPDQPVATVSEIPATAEPAQSQPEVHQSSTQEAFPGLEPVKNQEEADPQHPLTGSTRVTRRTKRQSVPSWDDIVFGSRNK